jgi:hypothetical protein
MRHCHQIGFIATWRRSTAGWRQINGLSRGAEILDIEGQSTRSTHGDELVLQLDKLGEKSITFYDSVIGAVQQLLRHRSPNIFQVGVSQHNDLGYLKSRNDRQVFRRRRNKRVQHLAKLICFQEKSICFPAVLIKRDWTYMWAPSDHSPDSLAAVSHKLMLRNNGKWGDTNIASSYNDLKIIIAKIADSSGSHRSGHPYIRRVTIVG